MTKKRNQKYSTYDRNTLKERFGSKTASRAKNKQWYYIARASLVRLNNSPAEFASPSLPGMLEAPRLLTARRLDIEASRGTVIGTPHRPPFLFTCLSVNWLSVATVLCAVTIEDVYHVLQTVSRTEPFKQVFCSISVRYRKIVLVHVLYVEYTV